MKNLFFSLFLLIASLTSGLCAPPPAGAVYPFFDDFESYNPNAGTLGQPKWYGGASSFRAHGSHGLFQTIGMGFESSAIMPKDSITSSEIGPFTLQSKLYFHYRLVDSVSWPGIPYALAGDASFRIKMIGPINPAPVVFNLDSLTQGTPTTDFIYAEIPLDTYVGQTAFFEIFFDMGTQTGAHWLEIDDFGVSDVVVTGSAPNQLAKKWDCMVKGKELLLNDLDAGQYRLYNINGTLIREWNHNPGSEVQSLSGISNGLYVITRNSGGTIENKKLIVN